MDGLFITVEGPDGAGKTSVLNELYPRLQFASEKEIIKTREPGGGKIAEKIRALILDPVYEEMDDRTEALLYAAARRQHVIDVISPALNKGQVILCDRFVDSSIAYQGAGRRIGIKEVAQINQFATEGLTPDFTLYLDVDSDTGLHRIQHSRGYQVDRLESEGLEFHQRVRHAYLKIAEQNSARVHKIDARMGLQDVVDQSFRAIITTYPNYFKEMVE
ncbi:dTMP kinase [Tetragenococcus koreensis]|uniref:Thymidylate kinase n=1 Tax=Tetragenococcus koreensis TaxID=290335 RepID=A0AAN4RLW5_9ENTE|nr:dTMP kinase [Tetragenococcus koreensis]MDN6142818.1 dTMP kinase [Tetragenococcus halophilus]AYW44480.1 dTMP kinase [Tetragenococcus koreensis]MCF1584278.1 dTMP kinase [Tetragenococcus koreensis]MCF1613788.1 dTMP kinase [Tetragenococcus koreensis]MCF1616639.1 dTMP kinase [Tetragenococcus koreensis]